MSELNIVDSSVELFSIDKKVITFQINHNNKQDISENNINASISSHQTIKLGKTSLIVTNLTSEYISLRTKTTKKKNYFVYPSYCNISPNSQQKLDFNYFVKEGEEVSNVGHKFKFEGFIISPEEKDQESKMLFNKYISQKIPVKAYKLKAYVEFIENEINIDNDGEPVNINHTNNVNDNINNEINNEINNNINNSTNNNSIHSIMNNNTINGTNNNINNENNNIMNNTNDKFNNNSRNNISHKKNDSMSNNSLNNSNNINNNTNNINIINNITEEKIKENENENNNTITEEEENNINLNPNENNNNLNDKSEKISNKNLVNNPSNKTLSLNINNSLVNKNESKENNVIKPHNKTKFDFNSVKDFESPKKKRFTNIKNDEFEKPRTEEENNALLNNLKVEYYKLKNELDNLIERYYNLRNHVDLEEDNRDLNSEQSLKNNYQEQNKKEIKLPLHICIGLFIFGVLLGFYLS